MFGFYLGNKIKQDLVVGSKEEVGGRGWTPMCVTEVGWWYH